MAFLKNLHFPLSVSSYRGFEGICSGQLLNLAETDKKEQVDAKE
jgi:hypothetical protein